MTFSPNSIEEHEILAHAIRQGRVILFTGAGFSRDAHDRHGKPLGTSDSLKQALYEKFLRSTNTQIEFEQERLDELCEFILQVGGMNPDDPGNALHLFLREAYSRCKPADFHFQYNLFPWRRIFTTNIDDVLEKVYAHSGNYRLQIHNSRKKLKPDAPGTTPYFKLHGCVNNNTEPFVFTRRQYTAQMANGDFRYDVFANDFGTEFFLFVGTALNEPNLELFLQQKQKHNIEKRSNEVFIVTTDDNLLRVSNLKTRYGAVVINCTAHDFVKDLVDWCQGSFTETLPVIQDDIGIEGLIDIRDLISQNSNPPSSYQSFLGYPLSWNEISAGAVLERHQINDALKAGTKLLKEPNGGVIVFTGRNGSGKSAALRVLAKKMLQYHDRSIYEWISSDELPIDELKAHISRNTKNGYYTLVIDNASINYFNVRKLAVALRQDCISRWLIVLSDSTRNHEQHITQIRDILDETFDLNFMNRPEKLGICDLLDNFKMGDPDLIKAFRQGTLDTTERRVPDVSAVLYTLTNSHQFISRWEHTFSELQQQDGTSWRFILAIAILDRLGIKKVPSLLLDPFIETDINETCTKYKDIISAVQIRSNLVNVYMSNGYFADVVREQSGFDEQLSVIRDMCIPFISRLEDSKFDITRSTAEQLLRFSNLSKLFDITDNKDPKIERVSSMYEELGQKSSYYSFILVQWALLSQYQMNFLQAEFRLKRARGINNKSYQVAHAYGNNCLKWAVEQPYRDTAEELFNRGMSIMVDEILDSPIANIKGDEFALHSLGIRSVKLRKLHPSWNVPTDEQLSDIVSRINQKIREKNYSRHVRDLVKVFQQDLPEMNLGLTVPFGLWQSSLLEGHLGDDLEPDDFL